MDSKLQQQLYDKYPLLFAQKDLDRTKTAMCWGIGCGDGWYDIIDTTCGLLQELVDEPKHSVELYQKLIEQNPNGDSVHAYKELVAKAQEKVIPQIEIAQVKEKWGSLRIYLTNYTPQINSILSFAESMSFKTCERCGNKGQPAPKGWVIVLCDPCRVAIEEQREQDVFEYRQYKIPFAKE